MTLDELVETGQLQEVVFDGERVESELRQASLHFQTAQNALSTDPSGAFQLLYDSARKALQSLLASRGLRVRRPPRGNHYTFVLVSRTALVDIEIWRPLNWMRELRNNTEYLDSETPSAGVEDCIQASEHVERMLQDATERVKAFLAERDS